jgi:sulfite reductase beta subunit-like hemoprotein
LNRLFAENIGEERILAILSEQLSAYALNRSPRERFGDFFNRTVDRAAAA